MIKTCTSQVEQVAGAATPRPDARELLHHRPSLIILPQLAYYLRMV